MLGFFWPSLLRSVDSSRAPSPMHEQGPPVQWWAIRTTIRLTERFFTFRLGCEKMGHIKTGSWEIFWKYFSWGHEKFPSSGCNFSKISIEKPFDPCDMNDEGNTVYLAFVCGCNCLEQQSIVHRVFLVGVAWVSPQFARVQDLRNSRQKYTTPCTA